MIYYLTDLCNGYIRETRCRVYHECLRWNVGASNCCCDGSGCGVNVTNKDPTVCINDILQHVNDLESRSRSELFTVEEVIARSVSALEQLIEKFETDRHMILDQYYKYWLHRQAVTMLLTDVASSFVTVVMSMPPSPPIDNI